MHCPAVGMDSTCDPFARKRLENILYQKQKHMLEGIRQFQDRAASILSRRELFATLHDILGDAIPDVKPGSSRRIRMEKGITKRYRVDTFR